MLKLSLIKNERVVAFMFLLTAVLSWALNTVLAKGMTHEIQPMALSFFRWFTALCVMVPLGGKRLMKEKKIIREQWWKVSLLSIFSVTLYNSLIYCSAQYTTATNMSFVIAATPAMTFVCSWLFLGEKESLAKVSGMLISLAGMIWIVFQGNLSNLLALNVNAGDLLTCGAILSWAVYSVLFKLFKLKVEPVSFLLITIIVGLPFIFPFYLWEYVVHGPFTLSLHNVMILLFLGIFPSIISYLCWNEGVKRAGPNTASMFFYLIPVFASLVAFLFLGESMHGYHLVGGMVIFGGFAMANNR